MAVVFPIPIVETLRIKFLPAILKLKKTAGNPEHAARATAIKAVISLPWAGVATLPAVPFVRTHSKKGTYTEPV